MFVRLVTGRTPPNPKMELPPHPRRQRGALQGQRRATYRRRVDLQDAYTGAHDALFPSCAR